MEEVGPDNVVQVVTDNGSAYVAAGKKLMKKYNVYWTSCAAHCIDLMFEEIGKNQSVAKVIKKAQKITNFIYNHNWLLAKMREICGGDIIRPGPTRFATHYLALDSLYRKMIGLKQLFTCTDWGNSNFRRGEAGQQVESIVLDHSFWQQVLKICGLLEPLYLVLRVVDTEVYPTMGSVYELMRRVKEELLLKHGARWVVKIIDDRWFKTLQHDLHAAGNLNMFNLNLVPHVFSLI